MWITPEQTQRAKKVLAIDYLLKYEPNELVKLSNNVYCTRTHDSLKLSNGKWFWWSRGVGGKSAVDYLVATRNISFHDAVEYINSLDFIPESIPPPKSGKPHRNVALPKANINNDKVTAYLKSRGISQSVIDYCIQKGIIYEGLPYHSAVFLGLDERDKAKCASYRSTGEKRFLGEYCGSDKKYSFHLGDNTEEVHIFEGAIDLLSYATLLEMNGHDYLQFFLLSLGGVSKATALPVALEHYLNTHKVETVYTHLDNDSAGMLATQRIAELLNGRCNVVDCTPQGKDVNDMLCKLKNILTKTKGQER